MKRENLILVAVVCVTILLWCLIMKQPEPVSNMDHTISVAWNGEVRVTPDTLIFSLRVEETAPTTAEAQKLVDKKIEQIKKIIKDYKIKDSDIKTTSVNVYEEYDWTDNGRKSLWYTASHSLDIKIKNANVENEWVAWEIMGDVSEIWWVMVNNVRYDIDDKTEYYSQARELALKKAKQKAEDLAKFAWVKVWKPISINEYSSSDYAIATQAYGMMKNWYVLEEAMDEEWWSDISLWEMKITLDVEVVYEIK